MSVSAKFEHIVIFVSNLNDAINDFTDLGFKVTRGGSHGLTENALIIFANQTYIELLALKPFWHSPLLRIANRLGILQWLSNRKANIYCRLVRWVNGDSGPVDWCVSVSDLESTLSNWRDAQLDILKSETFSRETIDGEIVRWYLGGAKNHDLPILLEDITSIDLRVPLPGTTDHPNGAVDIRAAQFRVKDCVIAQDTAVRFLLPESYQDGNKQQGFTLGNVQVSFAEHAMPYKVSLTISSSGNQVQQLDIAKSHGVHIQLTTYVS